jgi:lysophospholipase L1-like esterase
MQRRAWIVIVAAATAAACSRSKPAPVIAVATGATVLALGDSITVGVGADPGAAYPAQLAALTGWHVINAGVSGDTSAQAAERLPALLAEHRPALVVVTIGGNDFLRRVPAGETEANLRRIIATSREAQAQVLLVAVPQPSLSAAAGLGLSDHPLYAHLAEELKVPLHAGGWSRVLGDAALKSDQIHANAAGYRAFAQGLVGTLRAANLLN